MQRLAHLKNAREGVSGIATFDFGESSLDHQMDDEVIIQDIFVKSNFRNIELAFEINDKAYNKKINKKFSKIQISDFFKMPIIKIKSKLENFDRISMIIEYILPNNHELAYL